MQTQLKILIKETRKQPEYFTTQKTFKLENDIILLVCCVE